MIPNVLHFCWGFQTNEFGILEYLAIESARHHNQPDHIYLYHRFEFSGPWWDRIKDHVICVPITPPKEIFGNPVRHYSHQSAIISILALIENGGIYLDMDTITLRSFEDLRDFQCVMVQGHGGLLNAFIMGEKQLPFLKEWAQSFKQEPLPFRCPPEFAQHHEVAILQENCPTNMDYLFDSQDPTPFEESYAVHLNASLTRTTCLDHIDEQYIKETENNFTTFARRHL